MATIIVGLVLLLSAVAAAALMYHWFNFSIYKELTFGVMIYLFGLGLGILVMINQLSPFLI